MGKRMKCMGERQKEIKKFSVGSRENRGIERCVSNSCSSLPMFIVVIICIKY
jgi:hypothetical protein